MCSLQLLLLIALITGHLPNAASLTVLKPRPTMRKSPSVKEIGYIIPRLPRLPAKPSKNHVTEESYKVPSHSGIMASAASATFKSLASLIPVDNVAQSSAAAKIEIESLPPTSIQLNLTDIPVVGGLLSGTWVKLDRSLSQTKPSVTVRSPKDKLLAIRKFLDLGRLEFDLSGLLTTHVNVDLEANQRGVATVTLTSALIPKWPFGRSRSDWNKVTNMGTGETYYFNQVSGEAQYEKPDELII